MKILLYKMYMNIDFVFLKKNLRRKIILDFYLDLRILEFVISIIK